MIQRVATGNVLMHLLPEVFVHRTYMCILLIKKSLKIINKREKHNVFVSFYSLCCTYILDKFLNS